jgi:hypothetical protein
MSCKLCSSTEQTYFPAEFNFSLPGLARINLSSVYYSHKILVCLDCGHAELVIPALKLGELRRGMEKSTNGNIHNRTSELFGFGSVMTRNASTDLI